MTTFEQAIPLLFASNAPRVSTLGIPLSAPQLDLSETTISNAVKELLEWYPEDKVLLEEHQTLTAHLINGTAPHSNSVLCAVPSNLESSPLGDIWDDIGACTVAIGAAAFQAGFFALGLLGLRATAETNQIRSWLRTLGGDVLNNFKSMFHNFQNATSLWDKAKELFGILGAFYNAGGIRGLIAEGRKRASIWDWFKTGVIVVAQLVAWFATDGAAFIAMCIIQIISAIELTTAIADAVRICSCEPVVKSSSFIPAGSWIITSVNTKVELRAKCKNIAGTSVSSTLELTNLSRNVQVDNVNGVLTVNQQSGSDVDSFVPGGSYKATSSEITVKLVTSCKNIQGTLVPAEFDLTNLPVRVELANMNGNIVAP